MSDFSPLSPSVRLTSENEPAFTVTGQLVFQMLSALNPGKQQDEMVISTGF